MALIPWRGKQRTPDVRPVEESPLTQFRAEMDHLFDRFLREPWGMLERGLGGPGEWMPSLDITETDREITIRAEVPGIDPEHLDIRISGNVLTLSGEKSESSERKDENCFHAERRFGAFRRSIQLPSEVDADKVSAEHANGVVTIRAPKLPGAQPRKIQVKTSRE